MSLCITCNIIMQLSYKLYSQHFHRPLLLFFQTVVGYGTSFESALGIIINYGKDIFVANATQTFPCGVKALFFADWSV